MNFNQNMAFPLLQTKLFTPPARPDRVPREHLLRRLDQALQTGRRLVLVSATAGSGKTSLLAEWISQYAGEQGSGGAGVSVSPAPPRRSLSPLPCSPACFAWLSLDEEDNDPTRFWTYLAAALGTAQEGLGRSLLQSLQLPQPPPLQYGLTLLLNEIAALPGRVVLVLDDYHVVSARPIHEGLGFLLDHMPPQLMLALATRADPPLQIGRMRARGQLAELRTADLRFSPQEAAVYLNTVMGLELSPEEVAALEQRTEGWIVGLQLAALALQSLHSSAPGQKDKAPPDPDPLSSNLHPSSFRLHTSSFIQSFTGSHQYLLDYLTEEVLNRQPPEVQSFLLKTSVLERLCAELCDSVVKDEGGRMKDENSEFILHPSAFILEMLVSANLFLIPLDLEGKWYRYHHLFADLMRARLRGKASTQEIAGLHRRASLWLEANGFLDGAVRHALAAGDFDRAAALAEGAAGAGMLGGRVATLLSWFSALPEEVRRARPRLRLSLAWAHFLNGQTALAEKQLLELRPILQALPDSPENHTMLGALFNYLATIASIHGETARMHELAGQALAYLPEDDRTGRARVKITLGTAYGYEGEMSASTQAFHEAVELAREAGNTFLLAHVLELLASNFGHLGRLREMAGAYQEVIELAGAAPEPGSGWAPLISGEFLAGIGYMGLAEVSLERNELELAAFQLERGFELCRLGGILYNLANGYLAQSYLKKAEGDRQAAVEAYRQAERMISSINSPAYAVHLAAHRARLRLWDEGLDLIPDWAGTDRRISIFDLPGESLPAAVREVHLVTLARLHLSRGEADRVPDLYKRVCATAEPGGRLMRVIEVAMIHALALEALGDAQAAAAALERCLALAEPEGYMRLFVDEGEGMENLLKSCRSQVSRLQVESGLRRYIDQLLAAFEREKTMQGKLQPAEQPPVTFQPSTLIEPLSERELEVLRLVGAGYSNSEIAEKLFLSLNTVKKHTSNIFGKLGVTSRTQAVAAARQLRLLGDG